MKRLAVIIIALAGIFFAASQALASTQSIAPNGCPRSADNLQDFAGCLAPVRGTVGAVYRGTQAAYLDDDHRELLGAMQRNPGVPAQVTVPYPMYGYPMVGNYWSTMTNASAYVAAVKSGNPSYFFLMGMPRTMY